MPHLDCGRCLSGAAPMATDTLNSKVQLKPA
jgi:hypothetical protein